MSGPIPRTDRSLAHCSCRNFQAGYQRAEYQRASFMAYAALLLWPLVALDLYSRLPIGRATFWTILGGFLFLPSQTVIKFQMIPPFDKNSISNLAALLGCAVYSRKLPKITGIWPSRAFHLSYFD